MCEMFTNLVEHPDCYITLNNMTIPIRMNFESLQLFGRFSIFKELYEEHVRGKGELKMIDRVPILFEHNDINVKQEQVELLIDIILYGKKANMEIDDKLIFYIAQIFTPREATMILSSKGFQNEFISYYMKTYKDSYFCVNGKYYAFIFEKFTQYMRRRYDNWSFHMNARIRKYNGLPIIFTVNTEDENKFFTIFKEIIMTRDRTYNISIDSQYSSSLNILYQIMGKNFDDMFKVMSLSGARGKSKIEIINYILMHKDSHYRMCA